MPFPARIPRQALRSVTGCVAGLPHSMLGRNFAENRKPRPCGRQAPLPRWGVHFASGHLFAATYIYFTGTGALSEGGSGFAGLCSGLSPRPSQKLTGLLSLQSHGQQEEGNCPAGKPQVSLASSAWLGVGLRRSEKKCIKLILFASST